MKVVRMKLTDVSFVPSNIRFIDGNIEATFDGGTTWVVSPENDPRYGVQFLAPPLTGDDARCDAAYRMTEIIRAQVDAAIDAANAIALAGIIIDILVILIPINPLVSIVVLLAEALVVIGSIVLAEAFDEERYDAIQCIFYSNISENGQVSAEQLEAILTEFETQFAGSIAADVCVSVVFVMGQNGLSNAGSLTGGSGDCDDCGDWCYEWSIPSGDWTFDYPNGSGSAFCHNVFTSANVTHIEFDYLWDGIGSGGTYNAGIWWGATYAHNIVQTNSLTSPGATVAWDGSITTGWVGLGGNVDSGSGGTVTVTRILMRGVQPNPFGDSNCD